MGSLVAIPAAQYLRMSTEHQQYSIDNQSAAIEAYAASHNFAIVHTYSDEAKSGVVLKRRSGLRQLLEDVVGSPNYKTILVYDVSRWGRFQDADEAAHYEFICKSAGIPIRYCAEPFENDGALQNSILKTLKRTMAAEYSRELGVKVFHGQRRLAELGFRQGALPGYGLRRMLVSAEGIPRQRLANGERKYIVTDRVILVPGPPEEVRQVREIYRLLIEDGLATHRIASELNGRGVPYLPGSKGWTIDAVRGILTHPKYTGCHVYGRRSRRLSTPEVRVPRSEWTMTPNAFVPLVDRKIFDEAQRVLASRTIHRSNDELLEMLRVLLAEEGELSFRLIHRSPAVPAASTYRRRFGSLRSVYGRIGYCQMQRVGTSLATRKRTQILRRDLMEQITQLFPGEISALRPCGKNRTLLRLRNRCLVSVLLSRAVRTWENTFAWIIDPVSSERRNITLLARINPRQDGFLDFHVLPNIDRKTRIQIKLESAWLQRGLPLLALTDLCKVVGTVAAQRPRSA